MRRPAFTEAGVPARSQDLARSIKRTLEVLEYFGDERESASVGAIARELGYPQSSTSVLLRSLMSLGYLAHDESTRSYRPTLRAALIGRGIRNPMLADGALLGALQDISRATGELILLASQAGHAVQYVHVIAATKPLRMHLRAGAQRSLTASPTGHLFLSGMGDARIAQVLEEARTQAPEATPALATVMQSVAQIREKGYLLSTRTETPGGGVLGVLLPASATGESLAVCVGGVGSVIVDNAERFLEVVRGALARYAQSRAGRSG